MDKSEREKITSADLSALIVDSLNRAGIINDEKFDEAIDIAVEEINARKALGDY